MQGDTMSQKRSFREQLRRNRVALISLAVAVISLSYNTYRNELSEDNRTQRLVAIEVLLKIGELEELVLYSHYDPEVKDKGNPRTGWSLVLTIEDLTQILDGPVPDEAKALKASWGKHWSTLAASAESKDAVRAAIDGMRQATLTLLRELD
ncbi:MAG: hypothetical protein KJO82_07575 [Gammaproteobacteria bacterium]|nr:hypothetical protein [Gammaproteobacteria bacterium]